MKRGTEMQMIDGTIPVFGEADEKTLNQMRTCAKTADKFDPCKD
jgi:hypothetical protein